MRVLLLLALMGVTFHFLYAQEVPGRREPSSQLNPDQANTIIEHLPGSRGALHAPAVVERNYVNIISGRVSVIRHITTSPSGINGKPNEIIRATYGGNERICVNTGSGPGASTTWNCVTLGAI